MAYFFMQSVQFPQLHVCMLASDSHAPYETDKPVRNDAYGWHFQYLTILGLFLATLTFSFGLLADLTLSPRLFLVKNTLSMTSAPLEVLITTLYWGIRAVR